MIQEESYSCRLNRKRKQTTLVEQYTQENMMKKMEKKLIAILYKKKCPLWPFISLMIS